MTAGAAEPHSSEPASQTTASAAPRLLLWIEDEPELMNPCARHLRRAGFQVDFAEDGVAGLDAACRQAYDVIILDWRLPTLSGTEVLTRLRREGCHTPVLVLTGHGTEDIAFVCGQLGAVAYRTKPILPAPLLEVVRAVAAQPAAPKPFVSPTCDHLAWAIVGVIDLADDPRTFDMWARMPGLTEDSLHRWCKLLEVDGKDALTFVRILRAVFLVESHGVGFAEILDVADPKTLKRLFARAGLSPEQVPSSVRLREFLDQQTLLTHAGLLRRIVELVLRFVALLGVSSWTAYLRAAEIRWDNVPCSYSEEEFCGDGGVFESLCDQVFAHYSMTCDVSGGTCSATCTLIPPI